MNDTCRNAPFGIIELTADGQIRQVNPAATELLDVGSDAVGADIRDVFPESVEASVPRALSGTAEHQEFEEYYPQLERWVAGSVVPTDSGVALYFRDVTGRHTLEQQLGEREESLARLSVINGLISDILGELVGATTREEIAETICKRLGETDIYEFAWVGERDLGSDDIVLRAATGTTGRTLTQLERCLEAGIEVPEARTIKTGTPEVVYSISEDERLPETIRRAAFADGLQSLLAIPLTYGPNVYGVVGVYTSAQDAFSERERASFATLGEMAGFAVNATRHRNLLLSDTLVELTVHLSDTETPLLGVATEHDLELTVSGLLASDESLLCYLSLNGDDPEAVARALATYDDVTATRVIREYDDGGSLELVLTAETPLSRVVALGATIQQATFEPAGGELVIELSPEEDIRRIAETVTRAYDAEVVAKREREREITTPEEFRETLTDRLTERQEDALRTAFFADYFESPRGSSAQEVAEALGITGPTLLHHLRAGQRKLLSEVFQPTDEQR